MECSDVRMFFSKRNAFLLAVGVGMLVWVCNIVWMDGWSRRHPIFTRLFKVSEGRFADHTEWGKKDKDLWYHFSLKSYKNGSHSAVGKGNGTRNVDIGSEKTTKGLIQTRTITVYSKSDLFSTFSPGSLNQSIVQSKKYSEVLENHASNKDANGLINNLRSSQQKNRTADRSTRDLAPIPQQRTTPVSTSTPMSVTKLSTLFHFRPPITSVNCPSLVQGNETELERVRDLMKNETRSSVTEKDYLRLASNCSEFRLTRGYVTSSLTSVEKEFPIAFSLLMYKDIEQAERLLRAIYMPQNVYCIHVDKKASAQLRKSMEAIARCLGNVFVIQNPVAVQWGNFTVLQPELLCMKELWKYKTWKYFINLTGQEFPLKTNFELVQILTAFNGANNQHGTLKWANRERWAKAGPAPHGYVPTKGSVHIAVSRKYVNFLLHNKTALDLLEWVKQTDIPDETYFATLNHNPQLGVPGSYKGTPETSHLYPFLTRYKVWMNANNHGLCNGKTVRGICIFGVGDLPALTLKPHLFVNKFFWDFEHYARDCLEEWHYNKTRNQYLHGTNFDVSYYRNLSFVQHRVN